MKCISLFKCNPQIEVIDKSHCSLQDVPNFQNYSRSLEELFLDGNRLTILNDNVFKLIKLRRFSFSDNAIQDIPPDIAKLVNLVELDCSRNDIQTIPEQIKFLRGLQICDFSTNNIEYLPPGLVQLKNLTCLTLNNCNIRNLPEDFGQLKNLESLELRCNQLESLPSSLSGLESIKKLDIGQNVIDLLPDDIGRLSKLEYLLVDQNDLRTVPSKIGRLQNLQCLDLSQQGISDDGKAPKFRLEFLPDEIGDLCSLTDLHLSENHLQSLPDDIGRLKNLAILKVDNNYLSELNPNIGGCISMQELVLTANQIEKLPSSIGNLTDLRSLNVDTNLLTELPVQIGNLKSLGILSLRDNMLLHLPTEIGQLQSVRVMDLSGNRLEYLPKSIAALNLKALWLSKNQAQPLPKLQIDELNSGTKVFTCYLLPQQPEDGDGSYEAQNESQFENYDSNRQPAVSFDTAAVDDIELDGDANFVRHDTPHPRELRARHQKLLNNSGKVELTGLDNASFVISDNNNQRQAGQDNYGHNYRPEDQAASGLGGAYNHQIETYESNGLPEVPPPVSQARIPTGHVQTTSKLFEAFRQNSSSNDLNNKRKDDRHDNGLDNRNNHSNYREPSVTQHHHTKTHLTHDDNHNVDPDDVSYVLDIHVRRSEHHKPGLGLSIAGGKDTPPFKDNDEGIFVSKVTRGGPAEAAGVKMGDKILAVNDHLFYEGITHQKAVEIFKKIKPDFKEFSIRILRDPNDEFIDENNKQSGDDRSLRGDTVVTSSSRLIDRITGSTTTTTTTTNTQQEQKNHTSTFTRTYTIPVKTEPTVGAVNNLKQFLMKEPEKPRGSAASTLPPGMSLNDTSSALNRNNIIYTTLVKDYKHDLGLVLENRTEDNENHRSTWSNIVIADIKPNSIASRDGKLQIDDRMLSINGADVTGIDLERVMLMLDGTERFIRIVVSRGDGDDPLGIALRNMPTRPSLGSWFSSTSNMSHRPSLIESYQRPTFGSVSSLQKQPSQLVGTKPAKPPKPSYLASKDSDSTIGTANKNENPIAKPRIRGAGALASSDEPSSQMSEAEKRAGWRRERLKSLEQDVEMTKAIIEAQRRRLEEKQP